MTVPFDLKTLGQDPARKPAPAKPDSTAFDLAAAFDISSVVPEEQPSPLRLKPVVVSDTTPAPAPKSATPESDRIAAGYRGRPIAEAGKGLIRGAIGQTLSSVGQLTEAASALEFKPNILETVGGAMTGHSELTIAPEDANLHGLTPIAHAMIAGGKKVQSAFPAQVPSFSKVGAPRIDRATGMERPATTAEKAGDFLSYAGSSSGELLGSTIPVILSYMAGAAPAAAAASYVLNTGDIREELTDLGVNGAKREAVAFAVGVPVAALDAFGLDFWAAALKKKLAQAAARGVAAKTGKALISEVLTEAAKGAGKAVLAETPTEVLQEAIQAVSANAAAGRPLLTGVPDRLMETAIQVATGSAFTGGAAGAGTTAIGRLRASGGPASTAAPVAAASTPTTAPVAAAPAAAPAANAQPVLDLDTVLPPDADEAPAPPIKQPSASTTVSLEPVPLTEPTAKTLELRQALDSDLERTLTRTPAPKPAEEEPPVASAPAVAPAPEATKAPSSDEPGPRAYPPAKAEYTPDEVKTREITKRLAEGRPGAIDAASREMADRVPDGAVLVPVPNAEGKTESNKQLANAIAGLRQGVKVVDVLGRKAAVESNVARREGGQPGLTAAEQAESIESSKALPKKATGPLYLVDVAETTGATMHGARVALGRSDAKALTFTKRPLPAGEKAVAAAETDAAIADKMRRTKNRYTQHGDVGALLMELNAEQRRLEGENNKGSVQFARENEYGQVVSGSSMTAGRNKRQAKFTNQRLTEIEERLRDMGVHQDDIDAARSDVDLAIEVASRVTEPAEGADTSFDLADMQADEDFTMTLGRPMPTTRAKAKSSSDQSGATDEPAPTQSDERRSEPVARGSALERRERPAPAPSGRAEPAASDDAERDAGVASEAPPTGDQEPDRVAAQQFGAHAADYTSAELDELVSRFSDRALAEAPGSDKRDFWMMHIGLVEDEFDRRRETKDDSERLAKHNDQSLRQIRGSLLDHPNQAGVAERVAEIDRVLTERGVPIKAPKSKKAEPAKPSRYAPEGVDLEAAASDANVTEWDTPLIKAARRFTAEQPMTRTIDTPERTEMRTTARASELERIKATAVREYGEIAHTREMAMVLGLSGSGKSTWVVGPLAKFLKAGISDIDDHKKVFPEYEQGWGSEIVYQEAGIHIGAPIRDALQAEGTNYITSGVGTNTPAYLKSLDDLHKQGFRVHLAHVAVPHDVAKERVVKRFEEGGHFVRPEYIDFIGSSDRETFEAAKSHPAVAGFVRLDASGAGRPKVVEQRGAEAWLKAAGYAVEEGTERSAGAGSSSAAIGAAAKPGREAVAPTEDTNAESREVRAGVDGQPEGGEAGPVRSPEGEERAHVDGEGDRRARADAVHEPDGDAAREEPPAAGAGRKIGRLVGPRSPGERIGDAGGSGKGRRDRARGEGGLRESNAAAESANAEPSSLFDLGAVEELKPKPPPKSAAPAEKKKAEPTKLGLVVSGHNYSLPEGTDPYAGGVAAKGKANVDAIHLLKQLEAEGRPATVAEQAVLAKYVGWGSAAQYLDEGHKLYESDLGKEIRALLTPEEFALAAGSTPNAHYTTPDVARAMHQLLGHLGFERGRVLEPAMGSGIFMATTPKDAHYRWTGVELDSITARIAKLLYPEADVHPTGFEKLVRPDGYFDVVIGNVPFGNYKVADPRYDALKLSIHDYFFAKSLDMVRPGGIMALITSRYTMDRENSSFREYLGRRADLLGAIRLPNNAFASSANTKVVADIIVLQRRQEIRGKHDMWGGPGWVATQTMKIPKQGEATINEYFSQGRSAMLGVPSLTDKQFGGQEFTLDPVKGANLAEQLATAIEKGLDHVAGAYTPVEPSAPGNREPESLPAMAADASTKEGAFVVAQDGSLRVREKGVLVAAEVPKTQIDVVRRLAGLRDAVRLVFRTQLEAAGDRAIDSAMEEANRLYDGFVSKYGPINSEKRIETSRKDAHGNAIVQTRFPNLSAFFDDPDWSVVAALEDYDRESGKATKADLLTKRVLAPPQRPTSVSSPTDALPIVLAETGRVDMPSIARLSGTSEEDAAKLLSGQIFESPASGQWETAAKYLSGNVRVKLVEAKDAAAKDERFAANVAALEAAQPADLPPSQISAKLGAPWIAKTDVESFADEVLGEAGTSVAFAPFDATWKVTPAPGARYGFAATNEFGTARADAYSLLEDALNLRATEVTDPDPGDRKKRIKNAEATLAAQEKQQALRDKFQNWIWQDAARAERLSRFYNDKFNNTRLLVSNGSHLTLPGAASHVNGRPFALRPHQKNAIWRILEWGNTLLGHVVGAGKTYTMVAAAMEEKRLGLVRKPLFGVPNHMLEQFSREFKQLYPTANLLIASKRDFARGERQAFVARAAANDWDAIIMTHRSFESVGMSDAFQAEHIERDIDALESAIRDAKEERGNRSLIKEIEKAKKRREAKLTQLSAREKKDANLSFEEMGVDKVYIDEAHMFKNLEFTTKMKGVSVPVSDRAYDLYLKTQYLHDVNPGRGVVFATGTPISNSMAELYTMTRYLAPDMLNERGIGAFDAWAATFGELVTGLEIAPDGSGARLKTRFAKYQNIGELVQMFRTFADVQSAEDLNLPRPTLKGKKMEMVSAEPTLSLKMYVKDLVARADLVKRKKVEPDEDNFLKITTDGRHAALDMRLVDSRAEDDPQSKLNRAIDNIFETWKESTKVRGTQLVFSDLSAPGSSPDKRGGVHGFNVYDDVRRKLIERGVPTKEVRFIHEANTDEKKARLMADFRAGRIRVLLGSTEKMGAGMNVQDRLVALHHLDAPWRPSDIEQRNGRILRQGNRLFDAGDIDHVAINAYVTEGSFDAYIWQTLERKAEFIKQAMKGDVTMRELEELGTVEVDFATAKAIASGNPKVMEKAKLDMEIARLKRLERAHQDDQFHVRRELKELPGAVERDRQIAADTAEDAQKATDTSGDKFSVVMSGKTYTDRTDAARILSAVIQKAWLETSRRRIGTFGGYELEAEGMRRLGGQPEVYLGLIGTKTNEWQEVSPNDTPKSILATLEHMPKRFATTAEKRTVHAERTAKRLSQLQEKGEKPFEHTAKLKALTEQVAVIDRELQAEATEAEKEAVADADRRSKFTGEPDEGGATTYAVGDPITATFLLARRVLKGMKGAAADRNAPIAAASLPDVEARWQAAKGVQSQTLRQRAGEALEAAKKLTRHFPEIDPAAGPLHATVHELLLDHERAPKWAQAVAYDELARVTEGLEPKEVDLMTRMLVLPDILKDVEDGLYRGAKELPFGYRNVEHVKQDLAHYQRQMGAHPKVDEALTRRSNFVRQLTVELVDADLLPSSVLTDPRYYHRQVLAHFNAPDVGPFVGATKGKEVRPRLRGFQKERTGGGDFNVRYEQAEYEWVAQALTELRTKAVLEEVKALADRTDALKAQVRSINETRLGDAIGHAVAHEQGLTGEEAELFAEQEGPFLAAEALKPYKQRVAMGTSQVLQAILDAHGGEKPLEIKGFADVVDAIGEGFAEWRNEAKAARDAKDKSFVKRPFVANHPKWWSFLAALVRDGGPGSGGAAMIFKAIRGREDFTRTQLGNDYIDKKNADDLQRLAPEGYVTWQPEPGNHFFRVHSIDERAVQEALAGEGLNAGQVRDIVAMGAPKETWILPDWLAATLTKFGVEPNAQGPLGALDRALQRTTGLWKQYILSAPQRILKYNVNNLSGDADAAIAYAPGIFKHVPSAARDLWHYGFRRTAPEGSTRQALERQMQQLVAQGIIDAGLTATEIPDINNLPAFRRLADDDPKTFMQGLLALGPKYFAKARELTQYRENILRLAAKRHFDELLASGRTDVYAASNPARVDAVKHDRQKYAALLARDLIGDYGAVSSFTNITRKRTFPFLSFQEVNFKRYINLFRNVVREGENAGKAARAGRLSGMLAGRVVVAVAKRAALVNLMFLSVALFNSLFFPDEEKELRRRGRNQMHLILGRNADGSIRTMRVEGAFADFLEWFGLQDYVEDAHDILSGDAQLADKAADAIRAPINKVVQLWEPFTKAIYETITKRSTFPDVFKTTPIRDRTEHAFRIVALDRLYNRVTGKPVPPGNAVARLIAYRTDPGEAAYFDTRERSSKWLEDHGKQRQSGGDPSDRANALYYWKRAVQWGDQKAAARWLKRYKELGGSSRGIAQSVRMGEPLGMLNRRDQRAFRRSLNAEDRAVLDMSEKWYDRVFKGRGRNDLRLVRPTPAPVAEPSPQVPSPLRLKAPGM